MGGPAVADVKQNAAPPRLEDLRQHTAIVVQNAVRRGRIHMGNDVTGPQKRQEVRPTDSRWCEFKTVNGIPVQPAFLPPIITACVTSLRRPVRFPL